MAFIVDATSDAEAARLVGSLLREAGERQPAGEDDPAVRAWALDEDVLPKEWEPFIGSGIPEIVAEMFPPEPHPDQFLQSDGGPDRDAFDEAHEQWRDECLSLAFDAAGLPELRNRLERAERVRGQVAGVLARYPLPRRPERKDFPEGFFGAGVDERAYAREYTNWQAKLRRAAIDRDVALERIVAGNEPPGTHPQPRIHRGWVPADLVAISTLRALLDADPNLTGGLLGQDTRRHLEAMLFAADPEVHIPDPDFPQGMPIYEGPASEAHRWLIPGVYQATGMDGQGEFRVVIAHVGTDTASAAFPPAEHDSTVLNQIARILEDAAGADREVDDPAPTDADLLTALAKIDTLVADTGRATAGSETLIEQGALLSELLAEREKRVDPGPDNASPPRHDDGPDLSR